MDVAIRDGLQLVSPKSSDRTSTDAGSILLAGTLLIIVPTNQIRRRRCGLRSSKFTELLSGHSASATAVHALPHAHQSVRRLIATKFIIQHCSAENAKICESGTAWFDVSPDCTACHGICPAHTVTCYASVESRTPEVTSRPERFLSHTIRTDDISTGSNQLN